ncbi:hypothetical protein DUNSADRAFT_6369, partial [Dunaliella salina]
MHQDHHLHQHQHHDLKDQRDHQHQHQHRHQHQDQRGQQNQHRHCHQLQHQRDQHNQHQHRRQHQDQCDQHSQHQHRHQLQHQHDQHSQHQHHHQHQDQRDEHNLHHLEEHQQDRHSDHQQGEQYNFELHQLKAGLPREWGSYGDAKGFPLAQENGPLLVAEKATAPGQHGGSPAAAAVAAAAAAAAGTEPPTQSAGAAALSPPPAGAAKTQASASLTRAGCKACVDALATLSCFLLSGLIHEFMNIATLGSGVTKGLQLRFFLLNGVGIIVERALQAWGQKRGLSLPHPVRVVLTLTWLVAVGPLFSIPWIQAGYPAQMLRLVRVDELAASLGGPFVRRLVIGLGSNGHEDL